MSRFALLFSLAVLLVFSSCTKTGTRKACFTFSKESPKVNDTLYLLNCSENYSKFLWINVNGFYPSGDIMDSLSKHQMVVVTAAGQYTVALAVGDNSFYSTNYQSTASVVSKTITVHN